LPMGKSLFVIHARKHYVSDTACLLINGPDKP